MINTLGLEAHTEREALANLLDSLDIATNACRQMAMVTDLRQWILVAEKLSHTRALCSQLGQASLRV